MEILHAVEEAAPAKAAVDLVTAMRFRAPSLTLLHVLQRLEPPLPDTTTGAENIASRFLKLQEETARQELLQVKHWYESENIKCKIALTSGFTTSALSKEAQTRKSDLVVLSFGDRRGIERVISPSISEAFLHRSPVSILVSKGDFNRSTRIRALLATDHSDYCTHAINRLIEFFPTGVEQIIIVSCFSAPLFRALAMSTASEAEAERARWKDAVWSKNQALIESLGQFGSSLTSVVSTEPPLVAIPRLLEEQRSNLLILGAQGHGFFERLAMGSVSHALLRAAPCSTLVLRPAPKI